MNTVRQDQTDMYDIDRIPCKYCDYCKNGTEHTTLQHKKNYMRNYTREYNYEKRETKYKRGKYKTKN